MAGLKYPRFKSISAPCVQNMMFNNNKTHILVGP